MSILSSLSKTSLFDTYEDILLLIKQFAEKKIVFLRLGKPLMKIQCWNNSAKDEKKIERNTFKKKLLIVVSNQWNVSHDNIKAFIPSKILCFVIVKHWFISHLTLSRWSLKFWKCNWNTRILPFLKCIMKPMLGKSIYDFVCGFILFIYLILHSFKAYAWQVFAVCERSEVCHSRVLWSLNIGVYFSKAFSVCGC